MDRAELRVLLDRLQTGEMTIEQAMHKLAIGPYLNAGESKIDLHRGIRRGLPEVVYCEGKSAEQVSEIFSALAERKESVLGTRASQVHCDAVCEVLPEVTFDPISRLLRWSPQSAQERPSRSSASSQVASIAVVSAGSSDQAVHREAVGTLEAFGHDVLSITDAGVAGLQRILAHVEALNDAMVVIVVAGMDGALPSVVAGLTASPVIAVPTSVGYGASFGGVSALLAMLNSCAGGVTVVNIDNGFGAAYAASMIAKKVGDHVRG